MCFGATLLVCIGISRIDRRECVLHRGSIEIWVRGLSVAGDTSTAALAIARAIGRVDGSTGTFDLTKVASSSMTRRIVRYTEMLRSRAESVVAGIEPDVGGRVSFQARCRLVKITSDCLMASVCTTFPQIMTRL